MSPPVPAGGCSFLKSPGTATRREPTKTTPIMVLQKGVMLVTEHPTRKLLRGFQAEGNLQGKDPLQCENLCGKLSKTQTSQQESGSKSNLVILEDQEEECSEHQKVPNGDVGEDSAGEAATMNHDGTIPEECKFDPGEWQSDGWKVDPS